MFEPPPHSQAIVTRVRVVLHDVRVGMEVDRGSSGLVNVAHLPAHRPHRNLERLEIVRVSAEPLGESGKRGGASAGDE